MKNEIETDKKVMCRYIYIYIIHIENAYSNAQTQQISAHSFVSK